MLDSILSAFRRSKDALQVPQPARVRTKAPRLFISYRRGDSAAFAGRISDRLRAKYGNESIFMDIDAIPLGVDFRNHIAEEVRQCDLVFAIIGPRWVGRSENGRHRINEPDDFVRNELEAALQYNKPIIPILVDGAEMPRRDTLPDSLQPLLERHAVRLDSGVDFHRGMDHLLKAMESLLDRVSSVELAAPQSTPDILPSDLRVGQVFVSHATSDRNWVEENIVSFLNANGVPTWYSTRSISSAAQWEREILKGLESCDWFLLVVSTASASSEWVKDELFWAMTYRPTRIIPAIYQHCDLWKFHIRLPRLQYVDFNSQPQAKRDLLKTLAQMGAAP